MKKLILAGGCFWGVEAYLKRIRGVLFTEVGYACGSTLNPTYPEVCRGNTGHAEVVLVHYDETVISTQDLLDRFFRVVDPTTLNRQGADVGHQYRSGIYYLDDADEPFLNNYLETLTSKYDKEIVTEIAKAFNYFPAEEYHQDYLTKNPNGYCHIKLD